MPSTSPPPLLYRTGQGGGPLLRLTLPSVVNMLLSMYVYIYLTVCLSISIYLSICIGLALTCPGSVLVCTGQGGGPHLRPTRNNHTNISINLPPPPLYHTGQGGGLHLPS